MIFTILVGWFKNFDVLITELNVKFYYSFEILQIQSFVRQKFEFSTPRYKWILMLKNYFGVLSLSFYSSKTHLGNLLQAFKEAIQEYRCVGVTALSKLV